MLLLISFASLLSACALNPPDVPVCFEINMTRGGCVKTMSGERFEISETKKFEGRTWWEIRPAMIMLPASSWTQLRSWIIKVCKKTGQCDEAVSSWDRTVETIDTELERRAP
jgi:hypothetical protein